MTHLNIQQGLNIEVVSTNLIKKLYEAALSVPEPLEGELDAAYMSGNLLVNKAYRSLVEYLTGRFDDLSINVTIGYYIPFEDSAVLNALLANNIGDGIGVTEAEAANAIFTSSTFQGNTDIISFNGFKYFTKANTNPPIELFRSCSNLASIDMSNITALSSSEFRASGLTSVTIPNGVTEIPGLCFERNRFLTSVIAPDVLVIRNRAFDFCDNLTSFSDFSNVTTIEINAFYNCLSLTGILNAPNLSTLETGAFFGNSFEGIECIGTLSSIPQDGFGYNARKNKLTYIYLPYECTTLSNGAFARMTALSTVKQYDKTIFAYQEGETKTFLPDLSKITSFGNGCFKECFALPLTGADLINATNIGSECFYLSGLSGALTLSHLASLGSYAFYSCTGITSVDLTGSTVTSIPLICFGNCTSLTSVTLPSTVTEIGEYVFLNTNISSITIPNSVKKCGCNIVHNTIVPEVIFPEGVELITGGLFYTKNNSLTYIEIPSTVTNMGIFFHRSLENSRDNLCTVVIKATTPPELNYHSNNLSLIDSTRGDKFAGIYVPDSSLTAYQNGANAWLHSSIQAKLKPISQLLTDNPTAWAKYNRTSTV